ncbi:MAG: hypothetical protein U0792_05885 [Gemmataceae bacterium]
MAQIPIRLPDGKAIESITLLNADGDLLVYDLGEMVPHTVFTGGQILRNVQGRIRQFLASGTARGLRPIPVWEVLEKPKPAETTFLGYERLGDGVRLRWRFQFGKDSLDVYETVRLVGEGTRQLVREVRPAEGKPASSKMELPLQSRRRSGKVTP